MKLFLVEHTLCFGLSYETARLRNEMPGGGGGGANCRGDKINYAQQDPACTENYWGQPFQATLESI